MIKKTISTILLVFGFGQMYAQTSFYVRPKMEFKTAHSLTQTQNLKNLFFNNPDYLENPYVYTESIPIFIMGGFTIGGNIGVKFKNGSHLELGYQQDESATKLRWGTIQSPIIEDEGMNNYQMGLFSEIAISIWNHRIELLYYIPINKSDYLKKINLHNSYLVFGTGFKLNKKVITQDYSTFGSSSYDDIDIVSNYMVGTPGGVSSFITLGLSTDVYFNKSYWFSTSLTYTQGFKTIQYMWYRFDVYENGVYQASYNYNQYSTGSGFQLQFSRRLQVHPWIKRRRNKVNPNI